MYVERYDGSSSLSVQWYTGTLFTIPSSGICSNLAASHPMDGSFTLRLSDWLQRTESVDSSTVQNCLVENEREREREGQE